MKEIRKSRNLTLDGLARLYNSRFDAGLNKGTLSKYENGKQEPMISVVQNLAILLDVPVDNLLGKSTSSELHFSAISVQDISQLTEAIMNFIISSENLTIDGKTAEPQAVNSYLTALQVGLEIARKMNTP